MNIAQDPVRILHLYPRDMNMYGDWGNVLTIKRRLEWYGYTAEVIAYNPDDTFPDDVDIVIGGGGQDSGQQAIQHDLLTISESLHALADNDVPMLVICGLYQLFGRFFKTADGTHIQGIEIFHAETHAGTKRLIGNTIVRSAYGDLIGYENHSGVTTLDTKQASLGHVSQGNGNNGTDGTEGAVYRNVFGSYLHGSLLPKNPQFADILIRASLVHRFGKANLINTIDDTYAEQARTVARQRPR